MWIRTTDRKMIVEVSKLYIRIVPRYMKKDYCLVGTNEKNQETILEYYSSEEEVQFVLDKIYDRIQKHPDTLVYTIPTIDQIQKSISPLKN